LAVLATSACTGKKQTRSGKLKIVTTTGMLGDLASNIGGDAVTVESLMGPGIDPHLYRPTPSDVQKLQSADFIVYNGLELEGRMEEMLDKLSASKPTFAVGSKLPESRLVTVAGSGKRFDPHIWFDVTLWSEAGKHLADELAKQDPDHAKEFADRFQTYLSKLSVLNNDIIMRLSAVPKNQRVLVTAHDAFHYFGKAYDFEVLGIQGTSTATEAGAGEIKRLAEVIAERKIKAIFVETSVPKATVEALQKAVASRGWAVKIGGSLFSDAMGNPGTPEGTYIGMVEHNAQTIADALK
jgi:manganese/zinc/iron transport system substrate-binding protein